MLFPLPFEYFGSHVHYPPINSRADLRARRDKLQAGLDSLEDSLMSVDGSGMITMQTVDGVTVSYSQADIIRFREQMRNELGEVEALLHGRNPFFTPVSIHSRHVM